MHLTQWFDRMEDEETRRTNWKIAKSFLKKMKDECSDKAFRLLATLALARIDNSVEYLNEILEKYPEHPIIPCIKLSLITAKFYKSRNINTYLADVESLKKQYSTIIDPSGYPFEINCLEAIASAYFSINDKPNAKKYIDLIKQKAPDNPVIPNLEDDMHTVTGKELDEMFK